MKRPAVFFDRDNTLIISDGYLGDPSKVVLVDGAADAVARVRQLGYATVVFSNQSGVARGMFAEDAVHAVNAKMDEQLLDGNPTAVVDRHEFCPFHPEAMVEAYRQESPLRKPRPGMILQAAEKLALDLSRSWAVGDAPRDVEAGHAAGCRTILIKDPSLPPSAAANSASDVEPTFVVSSLREAIATIAANTEGAIPEEAPHDGQVAAAPGPVQGAASDLVVALGPESPAESAPVMTIAPKQERKLERREPPAPAPAPKAPTQPARVTLYSAPEESRTAHAAAPTQVAPVAAVAFAPAARPAPVAEPSPVSASRQAAAEAPVATEGVEALLEQILMELRRQGEHEHSDFSVSKLLAGIMQPVALAVLFFAYFREGTPQLATLLTALILQTFTAALLLMGRQR
jgi:D-glycero-D-manno-heptose 1,7-bisphosphate phosphatase